MKKLILIFICLFLLYSLYLDYKDKKAIQNNYVKLETIVKEAHLDTITSNDTNLIDIKDSIQYDSVKYNNIADTIFVKIVNTDFKVKLSKEDMLFITTSISNKLNKDSSKIIIINTPQQEKVKSKKWFKR